MKAFVYHRYGTPEVLQLEEVDLPAPGDGQVLVRVHAASVNPFDWHFLTGTPYMLRLGAGIGKPKEKMLGVDMAGRVESVGRGVTRLRPGDDVFGMRTGAFGEYVIIGEEKLAHKPSSVTFEQAAAMPMAGLTALQGLRRGKIRSGQHVLVNGASGGVGTLGVQLARAFGAHVTAVCSTRNVESVRALGADRVIDYQREDFVHSSVHSGQKYDLILDIPGNRTMAELRRTLTRNGTVVMVGGPKTNRWVGSLGGALRMSLTTSLSTKKMVMILAKNRREDLDLLAGLMASGKVTPFIERTHPLHDLPEAMRYVGAGHARGKVVISMAA